MKNLSKVMLASTALVAVAAMSVPAQAGNATSGNDKQSLQLYGLVNKAIMLTDDGDSQDFFITDNTAASTRFGLTGSAAASEDVTIGFTFEVEMQSNGSDVVTQTGEGAAVGGTFVERVADVSISSKKFGTLTVGQGSEAGDGGTEVDLSGTYNVSYSFMPDVGGGLKFCQGSEKSGIIGNTCSGPTVSQVSSNFDPGRNDRVLYQTPEIMGFQAHASVAQGGGEKAALTWSGEVSGFQAAGAIAYINTVDGTFNDYGLAGSASVLHVDTGLSLTGATGYMTGDNRSNRDADYYYVKVGYQNSFFAAGKTYFHVDFSQTNDLAAVGDEATGWSFGVAQDIDAAATQLYVGVKQFDLDRTATSFDKITMGIAGAQVNF